MREHGVSNGAAIIQDAKDHARADGRERVRPRDVEAVTKPREEPISVCSLSVAAVLAWETGDSDELDAALKALADRIGAAVLDAARQKVAA
jgi:hypothetical protein